MDHLTRLPTRDVKLAIEAFGLPSPKSWGTHEDLVERVVSMASDEAVEGLIEAIGHEAGYSEPPIADLLEDDDNTPFSDAEQQRIVEVLVAVKQAAEADGLSGDEQGALDAKLAFLIQASKHSRRKEWLIVAVTVISQPIVNGILTPTVVNRVLQALATGLGHMFGHPIPALPAGL